MQSLPKGAATATATEMIIAIGLVLDLSHMNLFPFAQLSLFTGQKQCLQKWNEHLAMSVYVRGGNINRMTIISKGEIQAANLITLNFQQHR